MTLQAERYERRNNENVLTPVRRQPSAKKIQKRYGLQELRTGAHIRHILTHPFEIASRVMPESWGFRSTGALLKPGQEIDRAAQDITRVDDDVFAACRWHCVVPSKVQAGEVNQNPWQACPCMAKAPSAHGFESKDDLQAAHAPQAELEKRHEIHLVYGVSLVAPRLAKKETRNKETGELLEEAVSARRADLVILSSTEL
jgi:hypothetical protein